MDGSIDGVKFKLVFTFNPIIRIVVGKPILAGPYSELTAGHLLLPILACRSLWNRAETYSSQSFQDIVADWILVAVFNHVGVVLVDGKYGLEV